MKPILSIALICMSLFTHAFEIPEILNSNIEDHGLRGVENIAVKEHEIFDYFTAKGIPKNKVVRAFDPINKVTYQKALVGPTNRATGLFKDYDYWRYVTVYNIDEVSERISYLPYFYEDCHDNSFFMAQWDESRSIKVTIKTELGFSELGLSASIGMSLEQGVTFSASRRVRAVEGIQAKHYPYKLSENWEGITYIQTYNSETETYGYLRPSRFEAWTNSYPYSFSLDNQNVGFRVVREIEKTCEGYNPEADPVKDSDMYLRGGRSVKVQ